MLNFPSAAPVKISSSFLGTIAMSKEKSATSSDFHTTESLATPVTSAPTSISAKSRLLQTLLGISSSRLPIQNTFDAYFDHYAHQCDLFSIEQGDCLSNVSTGRSHIATHQDIANVAELFAAGTRHREAVIQDLQAPKSASGNGTPTTEDEIAVSINWIARLMTMVDIGKLSYAFSSRKPLLWETGSLRDFLAEVFHPREPDQGHVRLEKTFNARNLSRLAGVDVEWTSDLASHLSLRDDDTKLLVFHHATFLENVNSEIFPPGFCEETLQTIALLLPASDPDTRKWYRKQQLPHNLDNAVMKCRKLRADDRRIENFHYWRERICILKQVFDEAEPSTLSQWWYDRRKGPQWYTFWVAVAVLILTVFFGVTQSIEGALQVYKAYHPS